MRKNAIIGVLVIVVIVLCTRIVRIENERYALMLGMCRGSMGVPTDFRCLNAVQTRTSWAWHLYYALTGP